MPLEVFFSEDGWYSVASSDIFVAFLNQRDEATSISANISMLENTTLADVEDDLRSAVSTVEGPTPMQIGCVSRVRFDVWLGEMLTGADNHRDHPCDNAWKFDSAGDRGEMSQYERAQLVSLSACGWSRVWILELEGLAVVMNVSRFDAVVNLWGTLEQVTSFADDLEAGLDFCADYDGC